MVYTEPAYAKLNLTLDILSKRPDGYHDLRMVMQSIDLADEVAVSPREEAGCRVTADLPYLPRDGSNIAAKAAARFFETSGVSPAGLDIGIRKRIPVCAGMAGGSSDGAAVLRILRRIYAPEMPDGKLEEAGAAVGSDVPGASALPRYRPFLPAGWWYASPPVPSPRRSCLPRCR